jgi:hypothetical protein
MKWLLLALLSSGAIASPMLPRAQQSEVAHDQGSHPSASSNPSHSEHDAAMMSHADQGMGFSQTATTHHFRLNPDGGVITVSANDPKDSATRDQIRLHLAHIAHAFAEGDFEIPMLVHDQVPPGVPAMKRFAKDIQCQFHPSDRGGQVVITSKSPEAVRAIHNFLVFQIREHKTGDSTALR